MTIAFIDLAAQQSRIRSQLDARLKQVMDRGDYIMGREVGELETALSERLGGHHVISCSSGTDALILGLLGLQVRPGDGIIVPSFTFAASAEAIAVLGASPVFAEVEEASFNLDPNLLEDALAAGKKAGLNMVGIMAVGLFGQPANLPAISEFAAKNGLWLLDDAAQSFGAKWAEKPVGQYGAVTATSFFPAKPLGCYGDGGALFTADDKIAEIARSCRIHGQGSDKYENIHIGMTARLDTMQAAILLAKLEIFDEELAARQQIADRYNKMLEDIVTTPKLADAATSSWAQYVIRLPEGSDRSAIQADLAKKGVPTAIYYPRPMHTQPVYSHYPISTSGLTLTEKMAGDVLALPMHPYLEKDTQIRIVQALEAALSIKAA
ncbi:MAG: DegT/DnrJ/EryC1/StrS family aminotransferase [Candidatus Puniceispirillaceae bacterium]